MKPLECLVREVIDMGTEMDRIMDGKDWYIQQLHNETQQLVKDKLTFVIEDADERYKTLKTKLIKNLIIINQKSNILVKSK